jgi:hypothetical protein
LGTFYSIVVRVTHITYLNHIIDRFIESIKRNDTLTMETQYFL